MSPHRHHFEPGPQVVVHDVPIVWNQTGDRFTFFGIEGVILWKNPSLLSILKPLREQLGEALFSLLIAREAAQGTYDDYHQMVGSLGDCFEEGFANWGRAVSGAGWGRFTLESIDWTQARARVRIDRPWELNLFNPTDPQHAVPFLNGKLSGIFSWAFDRQCRATVARLEHPGDWQDQTVTFEIAPSTMTLGRELEQLQRELEGDGEQTNHLHVTNRQLREHLSLFFEVVEAAGQFILETDRRLHILFATRTLAQTLGYDPGELEGRDLRELLTEQGRQTLSRWCDRCSAGPAATGDLEVTALTRGGETRWLSIGISPTLDLGGATIGYRCAGRDVTRQKQAEYKLKDLAHYDPLTGMSNRRFFEDRLQRALVDVDAPGRVALLFLDFDRFKIINDSLGHHVGDMLLREIAHRIHAAMAECECECESENGGGRPWQWTAARMGGDEFVVMLERVREEALANRVAEKLLAALRSPYELAGQEIYSTASIGVAVSSRQGGGADRLVRRADAAMYRAKQLGRDQYAIFDESMQAETISRLRLETELRKAVDREQFVTHYQPVVHVESGRIEGLEALERWNHPTRGLLPANRFIATAEETGLIGPIGERIMSEAVQQMVAWRRAWRSRTPLRMNINVSKRELLDPAFVGRVQALLERTAIAPDALQLEITESIIMDQLELVLPILGSLKSLGVGLLMDDFGTGHSSLTCLHRLQVDTLKLDRTFVMNLQLNRQYAAIVHSVITLAENLGMRVVAEGVETCEQLAQIQALNCDAAQGGLFAPAGPAEQIEPILAMGRIAFRPQPAEPSAALLVNQVALGGPR